MSPNNPGGRAEGTGTTCLLPRAAEQFDERLPWRLNGTLGEAASREMDALVASCRECRQAHECLAAIAAAVRAEPPRGFDAQRSLAAVLARVRGARPRRAAAGLALAGALAIGAPGPTLAFEFADAASCRTNAVPLGEPGRITAARKGAQVEVTVLANFGCGTTAGRPRVRDRGREIELSAETILPEAPTPACLCTRRLTYRFDRDRLGPARVKFLRDGALAAEGELR